ncbi:MAG TPA: xanthine dehydrogenase small subunit, partial [Candidatus Didemnitutus sp.]|nr:xanthine dehydrogenase small subunit [Candidatus Didemnitutus sp.]
MQSTIHSFELTLNGQTVRVDGVAPTTTLLDWLRSTGRTGSKCGCAEGDCGACTVALLERDAEGRPTYRAINSCIALLPMFAGRELVTVEGLASGGHLHPVQSGLVHNYGSQCGYCTPGFAVSMFEGYYRRDCDTPAKINDQLCGNLCRCTGYRPIRDAALEAFKHRAEDDVFAERLRQPVASPAALDYAAEAERFYRPSSLDELFLLKQAHSDARLVAGATEIGVELNKKFKKFPTLISTEAVPELTRIARTDTGWRIGAAATLTAIEEKVAPEYPPLAKMLRVFASRQIRNRATMGGNLATASPIGDSAPVLLAFNASLVLASANGERTVPLAEFFTGYRQTALRADEIIREIILPPFSPATGLTRRADFVKVSHRQELDISIVAAAFCVDVDAAGVVRHARVAYGGVAEQTKRALKAEAALVGKKLADAKDAVAAMLAGEFTPIDDVRSGAGYRRGLVVSLWEKFVAGESSMIHDGAPTYTHQGAWPVEEATKQLRHDSAVGHVTGGARYVDDTAQRRPMLEVWPIMAPHARAKITRR